MTEPALELHGISRQFGPVVALEGVSFTAKAGSIHALLGENGAGKTTLMRIAFGMIRPDTGWIATNGVHRVLSSPADAIAAGIGMVHQQFSLVPAMTVAENVALGGRGRFRIDDVAARISEVGSRTGLILDPLARVADLGSAERQKLEIVRTLAHNASVLILDEPTAVLTPRDIGELFAQLRLFADGGGSVILITHKLRDALEHADDVTVLRHGRVVLEGSMADMGAESLTAAMLGSAPEDSRTDQPIFTRESSPVATLTDVVFSDSHATTPLRVSLEVLGGEILGVAALGGTAAPLLRILAGRLHPDSGTVTTPDSIGFVPENRQDEGLVPDFTLVENFALRDAGTRQGIVDWSAMRERTRHIVGEFDVRTSSSESPARKLSGGNQQRFVLGRELSENPSLLILENPTQGLDVKSAAGIHERVRSARAGGTAVVFYSSDIDELSEISDRVLVIRSAGAAFSEPRRESIGRLLLETDVAQETRG